MRRISAILHLLICIWAFISIWGSAAAVGAKILWTFIVMLLPIIGLIVWIFIGPGSPA